MLKNNFYKIFGLFFIFSLLLTPDSLLSAKENLTLPAHQFTDCIDKNLGYTIKCDPNWHLEVKPSSIVLMIEGKPGEIITMSVSKSEESGISFNNLTPVRLQYVYDYADNFRYSKTKVGGKKALKITANSFTHPDIKFLDYFLVKDTHLYRINFTVNSEEHFEVYKPLFDALIKTFKFVNFQEQTLTLKPSENSIIKK